MANVFIAIGLILLLFSGIVLFDWGIIDIHYNGLSIKNGLILFIGIGMLLLWILLLKKESDFNHKLYEETHPTEIVTSVPPQIDTTITIKNGISDTTYTYIFQNQFINSK